MARPTKTMFDSSYDVKRYLESILARTERGELDIKKARALSSIGYQIQQCIYGEMKEREIQAQENLAEQIKKATGGSK